MKDSHWYFLATCLLLAASILGIVLSSTPTSPNPNFVSEDELTPQRAQEIVTHYLTSTDDAFLIVSFCDPPTERPLTRNELQEIARRLNLTGPILKDGAWACCDYLTLSSPDWKGRITIMCEHVTIDLEGTTYHIPLTHESNDSITQFLGIDDAYRKSRRTKRDTGL